MVLTGGSLAWPGSLNWAGPSRLRGENWRVFTALPPVATGFLVTDVLAGLEMLDKGLFNSVRFFLATIGFLISVAGCLRLSLDLGAWSDCFTGTFFTSVCEMRRGLIFSLESFLTGVTFLLLIFSLTSKTSLGFVIFLPTLSPPSESSFFSSTRLLVLPWSPGEPEISGVPDFSGVSWTRN